MDPSLENTDCHLSGFWACTKCLLCAVSINLFAEGLNVFDINNALIQSTEMSRDNHILHAYKQTGELADTMSHHHWCSPDPSLFYLTLRSFIFNHTESLLTTSVSNQHLITLINQIPMDPGGPLYICSHWVQECMAMRESGDDRVSRPLIVIFLIKLMDVQFDFFFFQCEMLIQIIQGSTSKLSD